MQRLFTLDLKDYPENGRRIRRDSARAILLRRGRVAMVHSLLYDFYKFPGGGIEAGETILSALIRETAEEAGLTIIPETVREYGMVHRIQKSDQGPEAAFVQDNFYYLAEAEDRVTAQRLDDYEAEARFTLEWVEPETAIAANRSPNLRSQDQQMLEREARVLELLLEEGYFSK